MRCTSRRRSASASAAREAVTHFRLQEALGRFTLLELTLETGRTHQIRVHFSAMRHPCVGDVTYGADPTLSARLELGRQWLHARELGFIHPRTQDEVRFVSDYPDDLGHALDVLRDAS